MEDKFGYLLKQELESYIKEAWIDWHKGNHIHKSISEARKRSLSCGCLPTLNSSKERRNQKIIKVRRSYE